MAWAWKPDLHPEWEVWVLFRVGQMNGFQRHGSGGAELPDSYLTLAHQELDGYGDGLPMPDKTGPGAFRDYVRDQYPDKVDDVDVTDADFTVHILYTGDDFEGDGVGAFQPGLYKVWQTNHDPYVGPPVAWVWQPDGVSRNIWLVYEKDTQWGYHLPGKRSPTNAEHYTPAAFRFEYHEDVLDPSLLATDYAAAIDAFRDWIMNEPTNDVVDPGQILPVEYDHRILKWPSSD